MTYTCENCQTTFRNVERGEDGPEIDTQQCAEPGCEVFLCEAGCRHLSFECDGCDKRFCSDHKVLLGGLKLCPGCVREAAEANGIECVLPEVA